MMAEPNWDLWRAFDAAMQARTLSGAARRLGVTQPTLGRQIEALERALGFALFVRSQKGLAPTEAAHGIAPMARNMAATADAMLRVSRGGNSETTGTVRLTASEVTATHVLPEMLAAFGDLYPDIKLELSVTNRVDDLLTRQADLAVRMVEPEQQALVARKLGTIDIKLYAHRDYLARWGTPRKLAELRRHRVIGYDSALYAIRGLEAAGQPVSREDFSIRTDNDLTQHAMLVAGAGIGGMQAQLARRHPELRPVLPDGFTVPLGVWLVMHEDLRHAGPTRLLFDHLAEGLAAYIRG